MELARSKKLSQNKFHHRGKETDDRRPKKNKGQGTKDKKAAGKRERKKKDFSASFSVLSVEKKAGARGWAIDTKNAGRLSAPPEIAMVNERGENRYALQLFSSHMDNSSAVFYPGFKDFSRIFGIFLAKM